MIAFAFSPAVSSCISSSRTTKDCTDLELPALVSLVNISFKPPARQEKKAHDKLISLCKLLWVSMERGWKAWRRQNLQEANYNALHQVLSSSEARIIQYFYRSQVMTLEIL